MASHAVIVGAGLGGLAAAARLAQQGWQVTVLEKNAEPGGRCGRLIQGGYRWDTGPTLMLMPHVFAQTFADLGGRIEDHLELIRVDPTYAISFWDGSQLVMTSDLVQIREQIEALEPGAFEGFLRYLQDGHRFYRLALERFVGRNFRFPFEYFGPQQIPLLFQMRALRRHYADTRRYVRDARLRAAMTFQDMYLGLSPYEAPATYALLAASELTEGIWFPRGGMYRIVEALAALAEDRGVRFIYQAPVKRIEIDGHRATGVVLEDGHRIPADLVVINADLPYAYRQLLPPGPEVQRLQRMRYSCGVLTFYWGLDRQIPSLYPHHVFLTGDYRASFERIFRDHELPDPPSFYLHVPSRLDPAAAPAGCDAVMALVPVGHLQEDPMEDRIEWITRAREAIAARLAQTLGLRDFLRWIRVEIIRTPREWGQLYNLERGAAFGLGHQFSQVGYLRPSNRHPRYPNVYFVGASTHPGTGLPMVLLSAKLVAERIRQEFPATTPPRRILLWRPAWTRGSDLPA